VALEHGLNANLLRRWVQEKTVAPKRRSEPEHEFVALPMPESNPEPVPDRTIIVIEVTRGNSSVVINWPITAAAECATWLRNWLE
jgi:transposase-like protein